MNVYKVKLLTSKGVVIWRCPNSPLLGPHTVVYGRISTEAILLVLF